MRCVTLFLLIAFLPSSGHFLQVLADENNCLRLRCLWLGKGEHCKPENRLNDDDETAIYFRFQSKDESDDSLLARVQKKHPMNTFTVDHAGELGEMCEERVLWCHVGQIFILHDFEEFYEILKTSPPGARPKLIC